MAYSGSGLGTINDPYIILTAGQLDEIRNHPNSYFELGSDIDASDMQTWDNGKGWTPIGTGDNPFVGRLDGKGHVIDGFFFDRASQVGEHGLFGGLEVGGYVRNLRFTNVDVSGYGTAVVAVNCYGEIDNVHVESGDIKYNNDWSGGISGYIDGTEISNCSVNAYMEVSGSYAGRKWAGLLVGSSWDSVIKNCKSAGYLACQDQSGGILGMSYGSTLIQDCYNEAEIDGNWYNGGIAGSYQYSGDEIKRCYNSGEVVATGGNNAILGFGSATNSNNYFDSQTSGSSSLLGTGRTTAQMKTKSTFQNWNIVDLTNFVNEIWFIDEGLDYPRLGWEFEGEEDEPERDVSASLRNKKQTFFAVAKVLNKAVASLVNKKQTLSASVIHEVEAIEASASLINKKQKTTGSINALVEASAVLKNSSQKLIAATKNVIGASAVLKNSKQAIMATAKNIVTAFGSLTNKKQKLKATITKEDARSVAATLKNKPQSLTSSGSVIVKAVAILKNKAQKLAASLKALNKAQATLTNKQQKAKVFISLDEMARVASVVLKNKPQRAAATLSNEVKLIIGLTNEKQKIGACVVDMSDRSVQVGLTNNPQYCKVIVRSQKMEADYEIIIDKNELFLNVEKNQRAIFIVK